jgi:hypothetical protein
MSQLFSNNAGTTLAADLTDSATSLSVASSAGFDAITAPDFELVTIENGALREIVKVTARSGTTWTIARAQEGTTAQAWATGSAVESRLTAGTLDGMMQTAAHPDVSGLDHAGNARGSSAVNLQPSRAAVDRVASGANAVAMGANAAALNADATAIGSNATASGESSTAIGYLATSPGQNSVAAGKSADATGASSAAFGASAKSPGAASLALGPGANSIASNSIAIGGSARAIGAGSISIRHSPYAASAIQMQGFHAIPGDDWSDQYESYSAGAKAAFATPYVDIGVVAAWQSETGYANGDVVKPTTGGTVQYRAWCDYSTTTGIHATPTSTATEPTWPGAGGSEDLDTDGDNSWVGIDWYDGYETESVPDWLTFHPTEILFVCQAFSALTGTPNISIGTPTAPTLIVDADDVTITGALQSFRFTLPNPCPGIAGGESMLITLNTPASAGKCLGRFVVSGFFVETKARA